MIFRRKTAIFLGFIFLIFFSRECFATTEKSGLKESDEDKWAVTLFSGVYTNRTVGKAIFNIPGDFEDNYMHALSISREFWKSERHFSFQVEGLLGKHHGKHKTGSQNYEEFTLAIFLRYHTFPWDKYIDTSLAIGEGISLTSETPVRELQRDHGKSQRLLNYLAVELSFTVPSYPRCSLVYRIHHRSGVFGHFGGIKGASDFYLLGLRYQF